MLKLVARGPSNYEIAQALVLATTTAKSHVASLLAKPSVPETALSSSSSLYETRPHPASAVNSRLRVMSRARSPETGVPPVGA